MLNRIILMGRLTRDPELRHTQTGTPVAPSPGGGPGLQGQDTGEKVHGLHRHRGLASDRRICLPFLH